MKLSVGKAGWVSLQSAQPSDQALAALACSPTFWVEEGTGDAKI